MNETKKRIELIDAIRGFAIMAILLIHCSNNFVSIDSLVWTPPQFLLSLNESSRNFLYLIFENKAYSLFALLFGFTYALQWQRRGVEAGFMGRMLWRMLLLVGFGFLNALFFRGGDPLIFYALVMLLVIPLIRLNDAILLGIALLCFAQPFEIIHHFHPIFQGWTDGAYTELFQRTEGGNLLQSAYANVTVGVQAPLYWSFETGRLTQTMGLFLLGIVACRKEVFFKPNRFFIILALSMLPLVVLLSTGIGRDFAGTIIYRNLFSSLLWMSALVLLFRAIKGAWVTRQLQFYGRMSLTNFIGQSVICCLLFHPWGFHLSLYLGAFLSIMCGLVVLCAQIAFSRYYLTRWKQGPLEALWHRLTWLGRQ